MLRRLLTKSRFLVILAVLGSLASATALLVYGVFDVARAIYEAFNAGINSKTLKTLSLELITGVDAFLLGTVFLIVALGLYELFIDPDLPTPDWLQVRHLDDLKDKLVKVVVVVLGVLFLGLVASWDGQRDLLRIGFAIASVIFALAFFLGQQKGKP